MDLQNGFSFNSIRKEYILTISKRRPYWAPRKRALTYIPGRPGAYVSETETDVLIIQVDIELSASSGTELRKIAEDFASWMNTEEPVELVFDDEVDRVYFAVVDGTFNSEEIVSVGYGTITFICPDPYKYGSEKNVSFQDAGSIIVEGSVESFPVITCQINSDTTFVAVSDGDNINLIGSPIKAEETLYEPESAVLISTCDTLTGWTNSSSTSIEGGSQLGILKTNGNFYTDDYGSAIGIWHGPAMKTSLGQALTDFRFDVGFSMLKTGANQAGGIEVALLDANNKIMCKVAMTKHFGSLNNLYSRVRAGTLANGHDIINENQAIFQSSISGVFRVSRKGNVWTAQVFYHDANGVFHSKILNNWTDDDGIASAPVTQVQARLLQRGDFPLVTQRIADINVFRLNNAGANQIPIIARAGDIIEFDHQNDVIRKNGEDFTKEKAFIGEYFSLKPGVSAFVAEPMDSIEDVEVRWRPRWR